jgi:pantoate--beta-alanine ligase
MGALHEGHLSLIRTARSENDEVAVSIFVNPTQFGPTEDFARYPRQLERDTEMAVEAGASWIFAPSVEEMYPRRSTTVSVHDVTDTFEGSRRPGHFDGVATVVLKLFNIVRPDAAYFGLKDLQQCQVVRTMVEDLNVPVRLRFCETLRESDGLAMSSRNAYLTTEQRRIAPMIHQTLIHLQERLYGNYSTESIDAIINDARKSLSSVGFEVDYIDLVHVRSMRPIRHEHGEAAIVVAAKIGNTRLIDNIVMNR